MLGDCKDEWLAARLEDLGYGDIDGICKAARVFPLEGVKKDELGTALGYFENNTPRMRYHWFRQCGLFVGSGVVEASCKTVIGQRLKQSGMHWTVSGADAICGERGPGSASRRCHAPAARFPPSGPDSTTRAATRDNATAGTPHLVHADLRDLPDHVACPCLQTARYAPSPLTGPIG